MGLNVFEMLGPSFEKGIDETKLSRCPSIKRIRISWNKIEISTISNEIIFLYFVRVKLVVVGLRSKELES